MARKNPTPQVDVQAVAAAVAQVLASGQFATAAPVAEVVEAQIDPVEALLSTHGLRYARGGRSYLTTEALAAAARVLKTGTPEVVQVSRESLAKRGITHLVLFRDGEDVATQFAFRPTA